GTANFEVRLYEGQDHFDIIYGQVDQAGGSATVGVQRGTGASLTQYECNTGGISQGMQLTFRPYACGEPTFTVTPTITPGGVTAYANACLPTATLSNAILPYWDDLRTDQVGAGCSAFTGGCGIFTSTTGAAPNRIFNIEWRAVYYSSPASALDFEVRLYEG